MPHRNTIRDGAVSDKTADMVALQKGILTFESLDADDMKAMVYGNMGLVRGRYSQKGVFEKSDVSGVSLH